MEIFYYAAVELKFVKIYGNSTVNRPSGDDFGVSPRNQSFEFPSASGAVPKYAIIASVNYISTENLIYALLANYGEVAPRPHRGECHEPRGPHHKGGGGGGGNAIGTPNVGCIGIA